MKLTANSINNLATPSKPTKYYDEVVKPLYLKATPTGKKGWYVRLRRPSGKYTEMKLGDYSQFTVKEARDEANSKLLATRRGTDVSQERKVEKSGTLQGFIDNRYRTYVLQNHKDATNTLRVLEGAFGDFSSTPLTDLTISEVEKWRLTRLKEVKPQTINRQTALLKAALERARLWGLIERNPLADLKLLRVEKQPVEFLNSKQVGQLMEALRQRDKVKIEERQSYNQWCLERHTEPMVDPTDLELSIADYLTPLVTLMLHAGLRYGEAIGFMWSDISDDHVLTVRAGKTANIRYVPLSLDVQLILAEWQRLHGATLDRYEASSVKHLRNQGFITMGRGGAPRALTSVKTSWGNVRKALSFEVDFRALRRTFGSTLIQRGSDIYTVSKLLGHANVATTQAWYLNLGMDEYKQAVSLLNTVDF